MSAAPGRSKGWSSIDLGPRHLESAFVRNPTSRSPARVHNLSPVRHRRLRETRISPKPRPAGGAGGDADGEVAEPRQLLVRRLHLRPVLSPVRAKKATRLVLTSPRT